MIIGQLIDYSTLDSSSTLRLAIIIKLMVCYLMEILVIKLGNPN